MDYRELQDILVHDIESLKSLCDRLSDEGEPLSVTDKAMIRHHLSSTWLKDLQQEQTWFFSEGRKIELARSIDYIKETLNQFS